MRGDDHDNQDNGTSRNEICISWGTAVVGVGMDVGVCIGDP